MNDNTEAFYKMSRLYFELGEEEDSLRLTLTSELLADVTVLVSVCHSLLHDLLPNREIRECLKLDPDHRECFPHYKVCKSIWLHPC